MLHVNIPTHYQPLFIFIFIFFFFFFFFFFSTTSGSNTHIGVSQHILYVIRPICCSHSQPRSLATRKQRLATLFRSRPLQTQPHSQISHDAVACRHQAYLRFQENIFSTSKLHRRLYRHLGGTCPYIMFIHCQATAGPPPSPHDSDKQTCQAAACWDLPNSR
jgi:hypothetical protein